MPITKANNLSYILTQDWTFLSHFYDVICQNRHQDLLCWFLLNLWGRYSVLHRLKQQYVNAWDTTGVRIYAHSSLAANLVQEVWACVRPRAIRQKMQARCPFTCDIFSFSLEGKKGNECNLQEKTRVGRGLHERQRTKEEETTLVRDPHFCYVIKRENSIDKAKQK